MTRHHLLVVVLLPYPCDREYVQVLKIFLHVVCSLIGVIERCLKIHNASPAPLDTPNASARLLLKARLLRRERLTDLKAQHLGFWLEQGRLCADLATFQWLC